MARGGRRIAAEAVRACTLIQRANIDYVSALRTTIVVTLVLLVAYRVGLLAEGLSLSFGVLFTSLNDSTDSAVRRFRGMAWMTVWGAVGVFTGGVISEAPVIHIVAAFVAAALCGYAGALGQRGGLIGTITLVLIAVFSGTAIGTGVAILDAGLFLAGGIAVIVVHLAATPLRRLGMARRSIARAYREFAAATKRTGMDVAAPVVGAELLSAHAVLSHEGVRGETAAWLDGLVSDLERSRFALLALFAVRDEDPDYVARLIAAAGDVARDISRGLVGVRRPDPTASLGRLEAGAAAAPTDTLRVLATDLTEPLRAAAGRLAKPWPVGRRAQMSPPPVRGAAILPRLASHWRAGDPVREHAIRLSLSFGLATLFAVASGIPHAYWLPMTVAWITKPDLGGTVTRVVMRVGGTLIGIIGTTAVLFAMDALPSAAVGLAMSTVAVATFFIVAYLMANYPIAVIGITAFVILLDVLAGGDAGNEVASRIIFTVLAGLWVLLISLIRPRRQGATALASIAALTVVIRDYADTVRAGRDTSQAHAQVLAARTAALGCVAAAATEPRGFWERPGPRVDTEDAAILLTDALTAASSILAEELLRDRPGHRPLWAQVDEALDDMDTRVRDLSATKA